jgi:hypothetical protein
MHDFWQRGGVGSAAATAALCVHKGRDNTLCRRVWEVRRYGTGASARGRGWPLEAELGGGEEEAGEGAYLMAWGERKSEYGLQGARVDEMEAVDAAR